MSSLLSSLTLFTSRLAHNTFPEKPNIHRLPRELQRDDPVEYRRLATEINEAITQVAEDHAGLVASAISKLRIPSPAIEATPIPADAPTAARPSPPIPGQEKPEARSSPARRPNTTSCATIVGSIAAVLTCALALVVALFGDSLCSRTEPPQLLIPVLGAVCPTVTPPNPTPTPTPLATDTLVSSSPTPAAAVLTPEDGSSVGQFATISGQVAHIPSGQVAFAVIRSTAFGKLFFPQGPIAPDEEGFWEVLGLFKSEGYSYETFVVLATTPDAIAVLSDPFNKVNGLPQLPPGAEMIGNVVVVTRR